MPVLLPLVGTYRRAVNPILRKVCGSAAYNGSGEECRAEAF